MMNYRLEIADCFTVPFKFKITIDKEELKGHYHGDFPAFLVKTVLKL